VLSTGRPITLEWTGDFISWWRPTEWDRRAIVAHWKTGELRRREEKTERSIASVGGIATPGGPGAPRRSKVPTGPGGPEGLGVPEFSRRDNRTSRFRRVPEFLGLIRSHGEPAGSWAQSSSRTWRSRRFEEPWGPSRPEASGVSGGPGDLKFQEDPEVARVSRRLGGPGGPYGTEKNIGAHEGPRVSEDAEGSHDP